MPREASIQTALVLVLCAGLGGCAGPEATLSVVELGSLERFETDVQPRLVERCAAGSCHGRAERPLALYAPGALRKDPARVFLDEPLDADEIDENALRVAAFAAGSAAEDSVLLCKPLAQRAGGCAHEGGAVFADKRDPDYRSLLAWLRERETIDAGAP